MKFFVALLAASLALGSAEDLFKENSVESLNKADFGSDLNRAYFVKFYAPWCGHCQRLAPTWEDLSEKFKSNEKVVIAKVDCTEEPDLCTEHEIQGYPTLKFFKAGTREVEKYRGPREFEALRNFVMEKIGEKKVEKKPVAGLVDLTDATFDKHIETGKHFIKFFAPWCGHCKNLAPTWDELAEKYAESEEVSIAKVDCTQFKEICAKFEVRGYPTLLFLQDGGSNIEKYQGSRTIADLSGFVEKFLTAEEKPVDAEERTPLILTDENFHSVVDKHGITFIKFFAPWCGHCRNLAPTWTDLAREATNARIAKVDCTEQDQLCNSNEVQGYPSLIIFKNGKRIGEYNGSRDLEDLKKFVNRHVADLEKGDAREPEGQEKDEL